MAPAMGIGSIFGLAETINFENFRTCTVGRGSVINHHSIMDTDQNFRYGSFCVANIVTFVLIILYFR